MPSKKSGQTQQTVDTIRANKKAALERIRKLNEDAAVCKLARKLLEAKDTDPSS